MARRLFTSESVTEGHPDKIADQISDGILDALLAQDPRSRVAVETLITTGQVHVAGEVTTKAYADIPTIVRETILGIGYDSSKKGFDGASCGVSVSIGSQSPDIAQGVDTAIELRSGASERRARRAGRRRPGHDVRLRLLRDARADAAADRAGAPAGPPAVRGPQGRHDPLPAPGRQDPGHHRVRRAAPGPAATPSWSPASTPPTSRSSRCSRRTCASTSSRPELEGLGLDTEGYRLLVNPTGRFEIGGPMGDAGLTGRKIIVDTYGGYARHGGGAFSGKDPSKVDRSAAYAMRWVAKNVVAAGLAERCEVQVAYAIGKAQPVEPVRRDVRHRDRAGRPDREGHQRGLRPAPGRDHPRPRPAAPDLPADRRLRPLRPRAARTSPGSAPTAPPT